MRSKFKFALVLLALCIMAPASIFAQSLTSVTGTIQDSNGIPYSFAAVTAQLIPLGGTPTLNGAQFSTLNQASADVNGKISMTLPSNAVILPASTQWQFTVTETGIPFPLGTGPQSFVVSITISGASQSITSTLEAAAPKLTNFAGGGGGGSITGCTTTGGVAYQNGTAETLTCDPGLTYSASLGSNLMIGNPAGGSQGNLILESSSAGFHYTIQASASPVTPIELAMPAGSPSANLQVFTGGTGNPTQSAWTSPATLTQYTYVSGGGTANAQTAAISPPINGLVAGLQIWWFPVAANTTTTPTLSVNGSAAATIVKNGNAALAASDLTTTAIAYGIFDGTNWELQNPQTGVSGCGTLPSAQNIPYVCTSTPVGGVAQAAVFTLPGTPIDAQACGGNAFTIPNTDRSTVLTLNDASACAVTLPQAGSGNFTNNFTHIEANIGVGLVTITPTTSTINGNASQILPDHWGSIIYSDNTNYRALTIPDMAAFPSCSGASNALTFTTATGVIGCNTISASGIAFPVTVSGTVTSGGIPYFSSTTNMATSALLATNALVVGGGAGGAPATGNGDFTYATHTLTGGAAALMNLGSEPAGGLIIPSIGPGSRVTTAGAIQFDTGNSALMYGNGASVFYPAAAGGSGSTGTTCANNQAIYILQTSGPTCNTQSAMLTSTYTNATTSPSNVTGISFTLGANVQYKIHCVFIYQASATTAGLVFTSTGPASPNTVSGTLEETTTNGAGAVVYSTAFNGSTFGFSVGPSAIVTTATDMRAILDLGIRNGTTAGAWQLQASASGTGTVTLQTGSICGWQ